MGCKIQCPFMTEQEIASYKEQIFDQPSTHTPASSNVPPADTPPVDNPPSDLPPTDTPIVDNPPTDTPPTEIVDADEYAKAIGYESWEKLKEEVPQLKQFKETAPKPIEYANEESKKVHELLLAGKVKEVKAIYDLQEKLETVDNLTPAEKIKLHIEQTNKHYKKADIEDVFEERYTYPEKPVQGDLEDDDAFSQRQERYNASVEKINRRIERDSITAAEELSKLKQEIKLPDIPTTPNPELEEFEAYKANNAKVDENHKILVDSISKLSEKDISYQLNFNDEAKKVKFDISYQGEKDGVERAKASAADYLGFITENYYKEDGSPLVDKLTSDIYFLQNRDKIMTEAINQAVNETLLQVVRNQKNIGDGIQRNFNQVQPDALQKLKEQVFGN